MACLRTDFRDECRSVSSARVRRPAWRFGADSGTEEALICVDVADTVQERLVEQGCFDGRLAVAEELDEAFECDGEGFGAWAFVEGLRCDQGDAAEAAWIDETDLAVVVEMKDRVRMGWHRYISL